MPTNKYFACPFCRERFTREDMVTHISRKHEDELPEGYTPLRATFHAVNRKDFNYNRPCRICKKPTSWDENKGRYNFLCDNPSCKTAWIENMKKTMGEKYGAYRPTSSVEGLEKMLAGRKISGSYKFTSGGSLPYTGSYEKKCLEFMDKVLDVKIEDIEVPGPAIKYPYKGEEHIYIPDIYYRPYNLMIEIKDGGDNPNKHPGYSEVRAKKIAKENYVIKHTDYNYLRLTNNDFSQLLGVFADLKLHFNNDDKSRVIHVHESSLIEHMGIAATSPMVGFIPGSDIVIVNNAQKHTFGVADSPRFEKIVTLDNKKHLGLQDKHDFGEDSDIKTYIKKDKYKDIAKTLEKYMEKDEELSESAFYEILFGHPMYTSDQIMFEGLIDYDETTKAMNNFVIESTLASIFGDDENDEVFCEGFEEFKSTFLNEDDVKYNYDAFSRGNSDVLFISGPESFGRAADFTGLAEQFGADIIHLDDVQKNYLYSDKMLRKKHILIYKYFCDTEEGIEERKKKKKDIEVNLYETVPHFILFFLANKEPNKRYIVEGTQLLDLLAAGRIKLDVLKKYSVLLKGSNFLQTQIQTMKSDTNTDTEESAFKLMTDYIDSISKKIKEVTHGNFSKSLKKKDDRLSNKDISDIVDDALEESTIFNEKDIYYNKDKFDSGEINLCFITGISGSGKSSMARNMSNSNIEMTELDDVVWNKMNYSMDNLKEYGELIYSFFSGPGKKYYYTEGDVKNGLVKPVGDNYEELLIHEFIDYAKRYAASHKNKKFVVEGVWLVDFVDPASLKDYAVYIKGTSLLVSRWRSAKRDSQDAPEGKKLQARAKNFFSKSLWNSNKDFEKDLKKFRSYFEKANNTRLNESEFDDEDVFYCIEDDTIDLTGDSYLLEVSEEDLKKNIGLSPVFVMLSFNGSIVGKVIKGYGKDMGWEYSHSSLSFSPSLSSLYSFNISKSTDDEGRVRKYNGFIVEHFRDYKNNPKCKIKVIAILVDTETKAKIKKAVQYYLDNIDKTKYAAGSLGKALLGTGDKVQNFGNMTLFCSQFVDTVLKQANIDIAGKGSSINVHPSELGQFKDKNNYFTVYEGMAKDYDETKVENKINYMKATMNYDDLAAITSRTGVVDPNDHTVENRAKDFINRKIAKYKANKNKKPEPLDGPLAVEGGT